MLCRRGPRCQGRAVCVWRAPGPWAGHDEGAPAVLCCLLRLPCCAACAVVIAFGGHRPWAHRLGMADGAPAALWHLLRSAAVALACFAWRPTGRQGTHRGGWPCPHHSTCLPPPPHPAARSATTTATTGSRPSACHRPAGEPSGPDPAAVPPVPPLAPVAAAADGCCCLPAAAAGCRCLPAAACRCRDSAMPPYDV